MYVLIVKLFILLSRIEFKRGDLMPVLEKNKVNRVNPAKVNEINPAKVNGINPAKPKDSFSRRKTDDYSVTALMGDQGVLPLFERIEIIPVHPKSSVKLYTPIEVNLTNEDGLSTKEFKRLKGDSRIYSLV